MPNILLGTKGEQIARKFIYNLKYLVLKKEEEIINERTDKMS